MPETGLEDLLAAEPLARRALAEITPVSTVGAAAGHVVEGEGIVSLLFESALAGYPGWRWTVTIGRADESAEPTVLEAELMPAEGALLAPEWVPWSERLAEYQAALEALVAQVTDEDDGEEPGEAESDDDRDIRDLHGHDDVDGVDIDGVDIDSLQREDELVDEANPAFDEMTDADLDLDLPAEEAAALEEFPVVEGRISGEDQDPDSAALAAGELEVGQAEHAEGETHQDRPEPDTAGSDDQHDNER